MKTITLLFLFLVNSLSVLCEANYVYHESSTNTIGTGSLKFLEVLTPSAGQPVKVGFKVEWQFYWNEARIYYTSDGTNPSGAFGTGTGSTQVLNATFDHNFGSPIVDAVTATIPGHPPGATIKYIVSAWHSGGGDEIFANGCGNSPNPFCSSETNTASTSTIFSYTVSSTHTPSIRINEFSQGASGAKEWVELVVGSSTPVNTTNCVLAKVNIAGWILDDNNGDFSPTNHFTGSGMATGHMRFKNEAPWNNLPIGAIIVIYNAADRDLNIPPDDPYDWVNNDCVYIVPSNHVSLEYCTTLPAASSCILKTDYAACTYVSTGTWANIGLANAGDAIQIRDQSFNLVHGLVYGRATSASGCTTTDPMVGNALAPIVSNTSMSAVAASFTGTTDIDYFNATKWTLVAAASATPGAANNSANQTYITDVLRGGCTCNRVLPLEDDMIVRPNINSLLDVKIKGHILSVNTKHKQTIHIYNSTGQLINTLINTNTQLDLLRYTNNGLNIIRVVVDDRMGSTFILKYVK